MAELLNWAPWPGPTPLWAMKDPRKGEVTGGKAYHKARLVRRREREKRVVERSKPSRFDTYNRLCFKWFSVDIMQWNEYILCINNNLDSPNKNYWIFQFSLFYYFKLWPQKFHGITENHIIEVVQVIFFHFYSHGAIIIYFCIHCINTKK